MSTPGSCCDETTTVLTAIGLPSSYSTVTCVLPSGLRYLRVRSFLTFASRRARRWARWIGIGMYSSVSFVA